MKSNINGVMNLDVYYKMIFKRKSFHTFKTNLKINKEELREIEKFYNSTMSLDESIKTKIKVVPSNEVSSDIGAEYFILFYSQKKDNYLQNIGFKGEQLDLYLASLDIGSLWYGRGQPKEEQSDDLDYVIMIGISKMAQTSFRKNLLDVERKSLEQILKGDYYKESIDTARYAPSALNSQPWYLEAKEDKILIYRHNELSKFNHVPQDKLLYFNRIDIGIFIFILVVCLRYNKIKGTIISHYDNLERDDSKLVLVAEYINDFS